MKTLITGLISIVAKIGASLSCIWAIIEFILYLVKDRPFNWWSVWSIIICTITTIVMAITCVYYQHKERRLNKNDTYPGKKSRFQQKLEEIAEKRNNKLS